jgi:serine/threonine protein phosphatase 1
MSQNIPTYKKIDENNYERIIAIGDLHGYPDPLKLMLERVHIEDNDLLIFIGDYIDRGPASNILVDHLLYLRGVFKNLLFLKGNHEDMLLGSIGFPAHVKDINTWLYNGGSSTLESYGMSRTEILHLTILWDDKERLGLIKEFIPEGHINFFIGLENFIESDSFFFCHAGLDPSIPVNEGKWNTFDLLWTRDHIYADHLNWEKTVVCGHTPLKDVLIRDKLICIDTGLYYYGTLSAIDVFSQQIFQVRGR